tara:strand:+ start:1323 stop:1493 length:171 start_codon:yes stop_codon:yes gene_type:complete
MKILVKGSAGFVGSAVFCHVSQNTKDSVTNKINDFEGIFTKMVYRNFMLHFLHPTL